MPGKALAVGMALWFEAGCQKDSTVSTGRRLFKGFSVGRKAVYRNLQILEAAGLIKVERHPGRSPVVTLLEVYQS